MNNTDLKIFTMFYIDEHDLLKDEKLALMEWVKDADMDQVRFLLATGEVKDNLTEEDKLLAETDPFTSYGDEMFAMGASSAIYAAGIAALGVKAYKRFFSKAAKACGGRSGTEKTACMNKFKTDAQKAKIQILIKGIADCKKTKNPEKCKASLQKKIAKEKAKLGQT